MKRILVLQNQRIGDTLQTTPLLIGLREKHRPCHITLLTNALFSDLNLGELVDEIACFDQNGMSRALSDPRLSLFEKYNAARTFLEPFRARPFDLVIDVPADSHMHLFASLLENAKEVRGMLFSAARKWAYTHPEVILLYTIGLCREVNRFNLVDLQNLLADVRPAQQRLHLPIPDAARRTADSLLSEWNIDPKRDLVVALQPGASEERKRWGSPQFARLARLLIDQRQARIILCGSASERTLGEAISREAGLTVHSAVGRTSVSELAALLRRCRVLVTNDTGTMHIAAAVGTPVVDISTGPVFFRETGPYAEGSLVIEGDIECSPCNFNAVCHHYSCREKISPDMIVSLVGQILGDTAPLDQRNFVGAKVHRATFNDVGRLEFLPVFRYRLTAYRFLSFFYAHAWEMAYGLRPTALPAGALISFIEQWESLGESWRAIRDDVDRFTQELRETGARVERCADLLEPLTGRRGVGAITGKDAARLEELQEIYLELVIYGRTRPSVRHFTAYIEMAIESQAGAEPATGVRKIYESLQFALRQVRLIIDHLEQSREMLNREHAAPIPA